MPPKSKTELARLHLGRALEELESDPEAATMWLFLAGEAAVEALASKHGISTKKKHYLKADAAKQLHDSGVLPTDLRPVLSILNEARKETTYEGEELDLQGWDIEAIVVEIENAVEVAEIECR